MTEQFHLRSTHVSVVVGVESGALAVRYWGTALEDDDVAAVDQLNDASVPAGGPDRLPPLTILPMEADGFDGASGIDAHRSTGWAPRLVAGTASADGGSVSVTGTDEHLGLCVDQRIGLDGAGVLLVDVTVTNTGPDDLTLAGVRATLPLPGRVREAMTFHGRWARELQAERRRWDSGSVVVENRRGRTSHDRVPLVYAGTSGFGEESGDVWAVHLGWSGNSTVRLDRTLDGRRYVQAAELLLPGEVVLARGESYRAPTVYAACSDRGCNGASQAFHRHLRERSVHPSSPRPVLLNTWEAVYFDHDPDRLHALADAAAEVGVERFVLDDGWFHGRRDDTAGLGDWWVDEAVWPGGLTPLIDHVTGLGMTFGLWVEPEMVNPDSDLYRAHPDWALVDDAYEPVLARHQLVLDVAHPEAFEYLLEHLDALLADHDIAFLKWDMNRDLVAPTHAGRAGAHAQTLAVYRLVDELRARHPGVEIESCASGGGRADFGILARTERIWTSDCNDALDRQHIQRGFSYLFPPELLGAHIGPTTSHTTSRTHHFAFRAQTAFFGHLGIERNLLDASQHERDQLAAVVALHKQHRSLLHSGTAHRIDHPDPAIVAHAIVAEDMSEAIVSVAQVASSATLAVAPVPVPGLDTHRSYRCELLPVPGLRFGMASAHPRWTTDGVTVTGRALATVGLPLPALHPESAITVRLSAG